MRKLRVFYFSGLVLFFIVIEICLSAYIGTPGSYIGANGYSIVFFAIPIFIIVPGYFLVKEIIELFQLAIALKNYKTKKVKYLECVEYDNRMYHAFKIKLSFKDSKGKEQIYWTSSDFNKSEVVMLKTMKTFDAFMYKDFKPFVLIDRLDMEGALKHIKKDVFD